MHNTFNYSHIKKLLHDDGVAPLGTFYSKDQVRRIVSALDAFPTSFSIGTGTAIKKIYDLNKVPDFLADKIRSFEKILNKKMEFLFYVSDNPGSENQNQVYHFDHIPKTKMIIHLVGDNSGRTSYIPRSHKFFWSRLNKLLRYFKISIAKNGCQGLPGVKNFIDKNRTRENKFSENQAVIFNTNCFHKAGNSNFKRKILIIHFGN